MHDWLRKWQDSYIIDGVSMNLSVAPRNIQVSTHPFYIVFECYENS